MINITLDTGSTVVEFKRLQRAIQLGTIRVINRGVAWIRTHAARNIARAHNVQVRLVRERIFLNKARRGVPVGRVWIGTARIPAHKLGRIVKMRHGARAGRHRFGGAFVATMPSGLESVFRRTAVGLRRTTGRPMTSSPNLPIREEGVELERAEDVIEGMLPEAQQRIADLAGREMDYRLNILGRSR